MLTIEEAIDARRRKVADPLAEAMAATARRIRMGGLLPEAARQGPRRPAHPAFGAKTRTHANPALAA